MTFRIDKRHQGRWMPPLIAAGSLLTLASLILWGLGCCFADPFNCTLAVALCWLSGIGSLAIAVHTAHTPHAISGVLGGLLLRMAVPLIGVLLISQTYEAKEQGNLFGIVVAYYLAILVIDTLLTVWLVKALDPRAEASTEAALPEVAHG